MLTSACLKRALLSNLTLKKDKVNAETINGDPVLVPINVPHRLNVTSSAKKDLIAEEIS